MDDKELPEGTTNESENIDEKNLDKTLEEIYTRLDNARLRGADIYSEEKMASPFRPEDEISDKKAEKLSEELEDLINKLRMYPKTTEKNGPQYHKYSSSEWSAEASVKDDEESRRAIKGDLDIEFKYKNKTINLNSLINQNGTVLYFLNVNYPDEGDQYDRYEGLPYKSPAPMQGVENMNEEDFIITSFITKEISKELSEGSNEEL